MSFRPSFSSPFTPILSNHRQLQYICGSSAPRFRIHRRPHLVITRATLDTSSFPPSSNSSTPPSSPTTSTSKSLIYQMETLRQFSRPHTVIGTILAILSLHGVAWRIAWIGIPQALYRFVIALIPALAMNVFIVGLNQIHDIPIDTVNKPHLPLPSGRLSLGDAYRIIFISLFIGIAFCWAPGADISLRIVLIGSALLGAVYSAPPFRLKRWPLAASACILAVRGLLVNSCFFWHAAQTSVLPPLLRFAVAFFVLFGIVIALLKDVPDIPGDRVYGIGTIAVRVGPHAVFRFCVGVLAGAFIVAGVFFWRFGGCGWIGRLASIAQIGVAATILSRARDVEAADEKQAYQFYMFIWKCFYFQYVLLPMAF